LNDEAAPGRDLRDGFLGEGPQPRETEGGSGAEHRARHEMACDRHGFIGPACLIRIGRRHEIIGRQPAVSALTQDLADQGLAGRTLRKARIVAAHH